MARSIMERALVGGDAGSGTGSRAGAGDGAGAGAGDGSGAGVEDGIGVEIESEEDDCMRAGLLLEGIDAEEGSLGDADGSGVGVGNDCTGGTSLSE